MPSAALLRKTMLSLLQDKLLPAARAKRAPRLMLARWPLVAPAGVTLRELPIAPLPEAGSSHVYPAGKHWDEVGMHAIRFPQMICVIEGEADFRIGATVNMLRKIHDANRRCGGCVVSLPAPSYLLIPPGVPHPIGGALYWERPQPENAYSRLFSIRVLPSGALCHISTTRSTHHEAQYSLFIEDSYLTTALEFLMDELRFATPDFEIVQAQFLSLLLRLRRGLTGKLPLMTDGLYSRFPDNRLDQTIARAADVPVLEKAREYIQLHLHEALAPAAIARHVRLTPAQLNRIFRHQLDTSVMRYITRQRLETAKLLLQTSDLSVQEIARLVGYEYSSHFSRRFHDHEGLSPLKFRQQKTHDEHPTPAEL